MLNLALAYSALIVVVSTILAILLRKKPNRASIPNFATVLGILGTFGGILYGLWGFDVRDINGSIPGLLDGLRTAFITSVTGISTAVLLRGIFLGKIALRGKKDVPTTEGATLDTLADLLKNGFQEINANTAAVVNAVTGEDGSTLLTRMREMRTTFSDKQDQLISKIDSVEQALVGEGESTLLAQMRETRATFSDKQDELIREFQQFAEKMAENNSRALTEALEEVMSFNRLNEAVGKLLEWQEKYKEHVETMVGQLRQSMEALKSCEKAMGVVVERSETFAGVADRLEEALGELSRRNEEMNAHLEALAGLGERAKSAFPAIQQNIEQITDGLTSTADGFAKSAGVALKSIENQADQLEKNQERVNAQLKASLEGQQALMAENQKRVGAQIQETANGFTESAGAALKSIENQADQLEKNQAQVNAQLKASLEGQQALMAENQKRVSAQIQETAASFKSSVESSLESMSVQAKKMDDKLREELSYSLTTLANQLASLSGKFVEDYGPLTDQLRSVVRIAEGLDDSSEE